jgi:hypothetical protein
MSRVAYLTPLLCASNVVTYIHHPNDTGVTLFGRAAVMLLSFKQCQVMIMPFFGR